MPDGPDSERRPASLVELRVLDGANLYFAVPAVKLVLEVTALVGTPDAATGGVERVAELLLRRVAALAGLRPLSVVVRPGQDRGTVVLAWPWQGRDKAVALGTAVAEAVDELGSGTPDPGVLDRVADAVRTAPQGEAPSVPFPNVPVVAVTGTNGKTTVTRLVAHLGRTAGRSVAWANTDGIYRDGKLLESGDWSGFSGAGRVLAQPGVGLAVLETARGGILRRGIGVTHNDVAVVTNVSADHLGLQGIDTVDQLAEVKATVVRMTRPGGTVVLNADDPRTLAMVGLTRASPFLFSLQGPGAAPVRTALDAGIRVLTVEDDVIVELGPGSARQPLLPVLDVPLTLAGLAIHNLANALAAAAAGLAVGLPRDAVVEGLRTFRSDADLNPGRLNLWRLGGVLLLVDLAHNEASLAALVELAGRLRPPGGIVRTILGTAGDRSDETLRSMGEIAARGSDAVTIAEKEHYLRGRDRVVMTALLRDGARRAGPATVPAYPTELSALTATLTEAGPGDVVAFMCHAERGAVDNWLRGAGAQPVTADELRGRARPGS